MNHEDKELDQLLNSWTYTPELDPDIHQKVRDRIHNDYFSHLKQTHTDGGFVNWLISIVSHPAYATVLLFFIIASTWGITSGLKNNRSDDFEREVALMYRHLIDPANSVKEQINESHDFQNIGYLNNVSRKDLNRALLYIEEKVRLDSEQSTQFANIHEEYYDQFETLYTNLVALENEYREFERDRISGSEVDFFEVYQNLNSQKEIYKKALQEQQKFIQKVFTILNSEQKGRYGELFLTKTPKQKPSAYFLYPSSEWQI